jgi:hypothetical protein
VDKNVVGRVTESVPELHQTSSAAFAGETGNRRSGYAVLCVVSIALSAAFLGSEVAGYGEAVPAIGIGLLLILLPFRALPDHAVLIGCVGLLICGLVGFLPARWFGEPEWHAAVRQAIPGLASTVSLQPVHSLFRFGVMFSAVLFGLWMIQWRPADRANCLQTLTGGIGLLAMIALAARFCPFAVPGWHPSQGFGPFSNRNQTGSLMALGAMLALGLCANSLRRRNWAVIFWLLTSIVCLTALIFSNSRAPLCLLLLGSCFWLFRCQKVPLKGFAIAGGVGLLICAAALIFGESLVRRLPDLLDRDIAFRAKIYQDTLRLAGASPVAGIGLGNFEATFPLFRAASLNDERVVHPESDLLWMASEMGWLSILFCAVAAGSLLIRRIRPADKGEKEIVWAGLIAIAAFLVNCLIDVPGHRLGTILPLLLLVGICTRSKLIAEGAKAIPWISRLFGIGLMAFGVLLLDEVHLEMRTQRVMTGGNWARAEAPISESLLRKPLSWSLYLMRGYADVHQGLWLQAMSDFRHARFLEPNLAVVPFSEGEAWVGVNRVLALSAWKEALRRSRTEELNDLFRQVLDAALADAPLHSATLRLADRDAGLAITALRGGHADSKTLQVLESEKSKLTADENQALLCAEAWAAAAEKDFQKAYELGRQGMRPISFPLRSQQSEEQCREALIRDPRDFAAAFDLSSILRSKERWQEALQILEPISREPNCPGYFPVIRAEILASRNEWSQAWDAIGTLVR